MQLPPSSSPVAFLAREVFFHDEFSHSNHTIKIISKLFWSFQIARFLFIPKVLLTEVIGGFTMLYLGLAEIRSITSGDKRRLMHPIISIA